ncbi:MAG TPA: hypothetical protein VE567_08675 [Sphingomonas sp.]|nr:hypothetical protein [Sphingomonas sp.]
MAAEVPHGAELAVLAHGRVSGDRAVTGAQMGLGRIFPHEIVDGVLDKRGRSTIVSMGASATLFRTNLVTKDLKSII